MPTSQNEPWSVPGGDGLQEAGEKGALFRCWVEIGRLTSFLTLFSYNDVKPIAMTEHSILLSLGVEGGGLLRAVRGERGAGRKAGVCQKPRALRLLICMDLHNFH